MNRGKLSLIALGFVLLSAGVAFQVPRDIGGASASVQPSIPEKSDAPPVGIHGVLREMADGSLVPTNDQYSVQYDVPIDPALGPAGTESPGVSVEAPSAAAPAFGYAPTAEESLRDFAKGREVVKVSPIQANVKTKEGLESYILGQKAVLAKYASARPDFSAGALVTFKAPTPLTRVEELVKQYDLHLEYFEWVGDGGISGASSTRVSTDINGVDAQRKAEQAEGTILGYKAILVSGTAKRLQELGESPDIALVDCGNLDEITRQEDAGRAPIYGIPSRVYDSYRALMVSR